MAWKTWLGIGLGAFFIIVGIIGLIGGIPSAGITAFAGMPFILIGLALLGLGVF